PQRAASELGQLTAALDERREVVRSELTRLAREVAIAVREEQLGLADTARVEGELARVRVRRRILGPDAEVAVAPRDPARLAAPAAVDDPVLEREDRAEGGDCLRREILFEARDEVHAGGGDLEHA